MNAYASSCVMRLAVSLTILRSYTLCLSVVGRYTTRLIINLYLFRTEVAICTTAHQLSQDHEQ